MDDSETCWHGSGVYEDCNAKLWSRNMMIRYYGSGCKWWHFYPDQTTADLEEKFREIMSGQAESGLMTNLIKSAKTLSKKFLN